MPEGTRGPGPAHPSSIKRVKPSHRGSGIAPTDELTVGERQIGDQLIQPHPADSAIE